MKASIQFFFKVILLAVSMSLAVVLPSEAKPFIVNFDTSPSSLDAHVAQFGTDNNYFKQMIEPLVEMDLNGNPIPCLAVSWESNDLKTWTFYLRKGVKFHDGTPFNADAVKFNIERLQNPETKSGFQSVAKTIQKVEVVDNYTIRMILDESNVDFPLTLQDRVGSIASPTAVKKYGKDFGRNPVGTGPFVFVSWKNDDSVTMKRNPDYWAKERVFLDDVIIKIVPDRNVAAMNLQAGQADLLMNVAPEHLPGLEADPKLKVYHRASLEFTCLYFIRMHSSPGLEMSYPKKEVRQALAYAIDVDAISKALYFGKAKSSKSIFPEGFWAYEPNVTDYTKSNVAKAKELLTKAGYPNGVELKYTSVTLFPFNRIAEIVKQQAAKAGIKLNLEIIGLNQAMQDTMLNKTNILGLGWSGKTSPDMTLQALVHSKGNYNNKNYANPEVDRLIAEGRSTADINKRKKAYSQIQKILAEDLPIIPILHMPMFYAAKKEVSGIKLYNDLKLRLLDVKAN